MGNFWVCGGLGGVTWSNLYFKTLTLALLVSINYRNVNVEAKFICKHQKNKYIYKKVSDSYMKETEM